MEKVAVKAKESEFEIPFAAKLQKFTSIALALSILYLRA
uniref:Uncharacterized protein n=1 Tax=Rhizophora mucronata TaxID=61149 RepID=A0A2P2R0N5_RHIMU